MRFTWIFVLLCLANVALFADDDVIINTPTVPQDETPQILRDFVEEFRGIPLSEKPKIKLSGDVRFEYDRYHEIENGERVIGPGTRLPNDEYLINANIYLDYKGGCDYAKIALNFNNRLGIFINRDDRVRVKKAYFGYHLFQRPDFKWFVELGRQPLYSKYDSELMYGSRLEGIFSKWEGQLRHCTKWYAQAAAMVLSTQLDEYAYIFETGLTNIFDQDAYVKLGYIDWTNATIFEVIPDEHDDELIRRAAPFRTVQLLASKTWKDVFCFMAHTPCLLRCKDLRVFGAYLRNIDSRKIRIIPIETEDQKLTRIAPLVHGQSDAEIELLKEQDPAPIEVGQKNAWYAGLRLGEIDKCGDWAFKFVYMYAQAFSYFPADNAGIGRNGILNNNSIIVVNDRKIQAVTNYKGFAVEAGYAISDHLSSRFEYQRARDIDPQITGPSLFTRYMLQFIYAF